MTRPYAEVIGDPIAHSKSPLIHNFWLAKLGIDAEYGACHVRQDELRDYFTRRRGDAAWRGCNLTMPHKAAGRAYLDDADQEVELLGVTNTIVHSKGRLSGFNTDVVGVADPLAAIPRANYPDHVATYVQIVGAGGAARAALRGAVLAGFCDWDFYNRSIDGAKAMADLAGLPESFAHSLEAIGPIRNSEDGPADQRYSMVVINATSMGMLGSPPVPIDLTTYYSDTIVFDMVYSPLATPLLVQAGNLGLRTIDGLQMLVGQAAAAFELLFGVPAPREHDAELRAVLTE